MLQWVAATRLEVDWEAFSLSFSSWSSAAGQTSGQQNCLTFISMTVQMQSENVFILKLYENVHSLYYNQYIVFTN